MFIITGKALEEYCITKKVEAMKKRYIFPSLSQYTNSPADGHVCCLFGLRRTGKTCLMLQQIIEIGDYNSCCYLLCDKEDTMKDLWVALDDNFGKTYFFIDEASYIQKFSNTCNALADYYAASKKIVIAGTDSLGLVIATNTTLFDRVIMLHTTYIPYKEYNYLLDKSLDDYIKYGGTLTDGKTVYNYNNQGNSYINSAIIDNIINSITQWKGERFDGPLAEIYQNGELATYILKNVELHNRKFILKTVQRKFKSHDLGSAKEILEKQRIYLSTLDIPTVTDRIRNALGIAEPIKTLPLATDAVMDNIKTFLVAVDVIYCVPGSDDVIFTQPGLRYSQCEQLIKALNSSDEFLSYPVPIRTLLCEKIMQDISGRILEDIIFYQLSKDTMDESYNVTKYVLGTDEFDLLIINKLTGEAIVAEVKHSSEISFRKQTRHLLNTDFCTNTEKNLGITIIGKAVIYLGDNYKAENGVQYLNAELFLCDTATSFALVRDTYEEFLAAAVEEEEEYER